MTLVSPPQIGLEGLRVFISYSRKDGQFVRSLAEELSRRSCLVDFDQATQVVTTGVSPSDHWWLRVQDMIAAADAVVLVLSPDSAVSAVVEEEISYAALLAKRIVAVTCRDVDFHSVPARLAALNVNHWFLHLNFLSAIKELTQALDQDVVWLRMSARLTADAKLWQDEGRSTDRLLVGEEIVAAELWSARRPRSTPEVSELVLSFIAASRQSHHERMERTARQVRKTLRLQWAISVAIAGVFIATLFGAYFVLEGNRELSRARSTVIARAAKQMFAVHDYVRALRLSLLAARETFFAPAAPEARDLLVLNARASRLVVAFSGHTGPLSGMEFADGNKTLITWSEQDQTIRMWDADTGDQRHLLDLQSLNVGPVHLVSFAPAGRYLVVSGKGGWIFFKVIKAGLVRMTSGDDDAGYGGVIFSEDGRQMAMNTRGKLYAWAIGNFGEPHLAVDIAEIQHFEFSRSGDQIVAWEYSGEIHQWTLSTTPAAGSSFAFGNTPIGGSAFSLSDDGQTAITWGDRVNVLDLPNSKRRFPQIDLESWVEGVRFSPDGLHFLAWTRGSTQWSAESAYLFDARKGTRTGSVMRNPSWVADALFSADGGRILTRSDNTVGVWTRDGEPEPPLLRHQGKILGAMFTSDGRTIITWGSDGNIRVWDSDTYSGNGSGTVRVRLVLAEMIHGKSISGARLFADDTRLATYGEDGTVKIWSLEGIRPEDDHGFVVDTDDKRRLSVSTDVSELLEFNPDAPQRLWDHSISLAGMSGAEMLRHLCDSKLRDKGAAHGSVRVIDDTDTDLVPLLQGREGEDVCNWSSTWFENAADLAVRLSAQEAQQTSSCFPKDRKTKPTGEKLRWPAIGPATSTQKGINISTPTSTPIHAAGNGVVIYAATTLKELGPAVLIRHDTGLVTVYGYLRELNVERGAKVAQGAVIGLSGTDASSGIAQLHFEVRVDAVPADPLDYLDDVEGICPQSPFQ